MEGLKWKVTGEEAGKQAGVKDPEHQAEHDAFTPDNEEDREGP